MGSHMLVEVLRQGVWASLTGGWFHDPRQSIFINTVHLYLWLFLIALPLTLCMYFTSTPAVWSIYCGTVGTVFTLIKLLNLRFHHLFDTTDPVLLPERESESVDLDDKRSKANQNVGLNESEGIELQDLAVNRSRNVASRVDSTSGQATSELKVDVHQKNVSSSTSSTRSSLSSTHSAQQNTDNTKETKPNELETVVVHDIRYASERDDSQENVSSLSVNCDTQDFPSLSPVSQGASILSSDAVDQEQRGNLKNVFSLDSSLAPEDDLASTTLKGTTSLELGKVFSKDDNKNNTTSNFRRTQSELGTSCSTPCGNNKVSDNAMADHPETKCDSILTSQSAQNLKYSNSSDNKAIFHIGSKPSSGQEFNITGENDKHDSESDSKGDSESDEEQMRSQTPLLSRHNVGDQKNNKAAGSSKGSDAEKAASTMVSQGKRVSFSARSLDTSQHYFHPRNKGRSKQYDISRDRDNRLGKDKRRRSCEKKLLNANLENEKNDNSKFSEQKVKCNKHASENDSPKQEDKAGAEKRFVLIPRNDSMIGWNQAGGPFPSQWLFQAVNVASRAGTSSMSGSSGNIATEGAEDGQGDNASISSADSNSFAGLSWLFSSNSDISKFTCARDSVELECSGEPVASCSSSMSQGQEKKVCYVSKIEDVMPCSSSSSSHRHISTSHSSSRRSSRPDRENSPRVLERLLEETNDPTSKSTTLEAQREYFNLGKLRDAHPSKHKSGRRRKRHPGGHSIISEEAQHNGASSTTFINSAAREMRHHLKSLVPQNSLDISGSSGTMNSGTYSGTFRPRDESIDTSVNRHRLLVRLSANNRRSLERRWDPYSPIIPNTCSTGPGSHLASSHDDTSEGAIHYFQDERGNWLSYRFSDSEGSRNPGSHVLQTTPEYSETSLIGNEPTQSSSIHTNLVSTSSSGNGMAIKTPSSSESWSSGSSTELAVDTSTNKMYASYRHHTRLPLMSRSAVCRNSFEISPSPVPSVPSLVTIPPDLSTISNSASNNGFPITGMPSPLMSSLRRSIQNHRYAFEEFAESFRTRGRYPVTSRVGQEQTTIQGINLPIATGNGVSTSRKGCSNNRPKTEQKQPRQYYNMKLISFVPTYIVKVWFDRLKLMALFDRNRTLLESLLSVLLAVGVASLGSFMLHQDYYHELSTMILCFVMASCQFSLLKSVQPDAASPMHGFNRMVAFSRPIYFCLCGGIVYILQNMLNNDVHDLGIYLYSVDLTQKVIFETLKDGLLLLILCFPILFSIGLFPQFNTFCIYLLEQVDMHCFGGNAASSLTSAIIGLLRSLMASGLLYIFSYVAMSETKSTQHLVFSIFCGLLIAACYHLSRCTSDFRIMGHVLKQLFCPDEDCFGEPDQTVKTPVVEDGGDPLPRKLNETVTARLKSDMIICTLIGLLTFGLHSSTVFSALQPGLTLTLWIASIVIGFFLHYLIPQLRKQLPCLLFSHPVLPPDEINQFEVRDAAKLMWFEKIFVWLCFFERNVLFPLLFISALTEDSVNVISDDHFGLGFGSFMIVICGMKALRTSYSDPGKHYIVLFFTILFFNFDWTGYSETFLVDFFFMNILFHKTHELWLKIQFVVTYIAPWQITWGSAFHAFAQPFSVPHSAMLFLQAIISSILSAPLNPFMGSAIFITSYVRPIKFWEKDYNTKRVDHSNTRLSTHLEKNPGADDNNLNSIFYEHLTRSLQDCLCGDLTLGRWGQVSQGDCFVLASDYLNCLVHIIEIGNGLVTFQVRGLEFRGTYCQQREVEAISEGVEDDDGFCCCEPGHPPHMLSVNSAFSQRWLAWEVTISKYVLEGYSISDNSAVSMLQVYDLRKILITYYVKSIIYYAIKSEKLEQWLNMESIINALKPTLERNYAELDPVFSCNIDQDYDFGVAGVTRMSFCASYLTWIQYCLRKKKMDSEILCHRDSDVVSLCFALSILGRRALGVAAQSNALSSVEFFLYGLHALFKGDFRITSQKDEWVFSDMDLLKGVVSAAVRMSVKLHQDHFMCPDEYEDSAALFDAIGYYDDHLVISHEGDPAWRNAVLSGTPALLALRHVLDDGNDEYKIIMLNKRHLSFRVIKLNRECVRGLWAGQQQELVYLRNRDPERGSIQNAKQALRNIINSSCDIPIGYPIYVSPLTTSFADTHKQVCALVGGPISLVKIKDSIISLWRRIRKRVGEGCSSGSAIPHEEACGAHEGSIIPPSSNITPGIAGVLNLSGSQSLDGSQMGSSVGRGSLTRGNFNRGSVASNVSGSYGKPSTSTLASLAGFLTDTNGSSRDKEKSEAPRDKDRESSRDREKSSSLRRVRIVDANLVYDGLNMGRRIDVLWPEESMRSRGGRSFWQNWVPEDGMEGVVVHKWVPAHREPLCRSVTDKTILLVKIEDMYVPIAEAGVVDIAQETT